MIDRELLNSGYPLEGFPSFQCPTCQRGTLLVAKDTYTERQPQYSKNLQNHDHWEPDWKTARFSVFLNCSNEKCGEWVAVLGNILVDEFIDEVDGWGLQDFLIPKSMNPSPRLITLPKKIPEEIKNQLLKSFELFWIDYNGSANRIRASVEALLTEMKVPRFPRTGKRVPLSLNARIDKFNNAEKEIRETLHALRIVGNVGSHSGDVEKIALLDAYEIYEDVLEKLFGNKEERLNSIKEKIKKTKGNYKKK